MNELKKPNRNEIIKQILPIEMPDKEKEHRMRKMRNIIDQNNVFRWDGKIITELITIRK